jgi:hypothetical protein
MNIDEPPAQVVAVVGQWLVVDGSVRTLSPAEVAADYEVQS